MGTALLFKLEVKVTRLSLHPRWEFAQTNMECKEISERRDSLEAYNVHEPCMVFILI